MAQGYAQDAAKSTIAGMPGSKVIAFDIDDFTIKDTYFVTPFSDISFGWTVVWFQGKPVWYMQYSGEYPKRVIPFLKRCLNEAYAAGKFFCGRGPWIVEGGDLVYENSPGAYRSFDDFSGLEIIRDVNDHRLGSHRYNGGSLLKS
jgi:hypothetical protein